MIRIVCSFLLVAGVHGQVSAENVSAEREALNRFSDQAGPLVLSDDGKWRIHVDGSNVMHRVSLQDRRQSHALRLAWPVNTLATSATGNRVAFTSASHCIGIVDFDRAAPVIRWIQSGLPLATQEAPPELSAPGKPEEQRCGEEPGGALALSSDGRLLASDAMVYDLKQQRIVTRLARSELAVKFAFADNDSKLLMVSAVTGEGDESIGVPSALLVSIWSLADRSLFQLFSRDHTNLDAPLAWFVDFSRQTNRITWGDAGPGSAPLNWPPRMEVKSRIAGNCGAPGSAGWPLPLFDWENAVVDPHGRWVAAVRKLDEQADTKALRDGYAQELMVFDMRTHRDMGRLLLKHGMRALRASRDGKTIFGLNGGDEKLNGSYRRANLGGDVITFDIAPALAAPGQATPLWNKERCPEEGESPDARSIVRVPHRLQPLWTLPLPPADEACNAAPGAPATLILRDGSVWIRGDQELAQIDTATGKLGARRPFPDKNGACTMPVAAAGGFVRFQGDTLSVAPFDGDARALAWRAADVRPGWKVNKVWAQGRSLRAHWVANEETLSETDGQRAQQNLRIVTYNAASMREVASESANVDEVDFVGHETDPGVFDAYAPPCEDALGPLATGYEARRSHFGTLRGYACDGRAGKARTVFWADVQLGAGTDNVAGISVSDVWGVDGSLVVMRDWSDLLHVIDLATRRDIAQIDVRKLRTVTAVQILASKGLVLVETGATAQGEAGLLHAYSMGQIK